MVVKIRHSVVVIAEQGPLSPGSLALILQVYHKMKTGCKASQDVFLPWMAIGLPTLVQESGCDK